MTIEVNSEVIINSGMHQYQRGRIVDVDTATEIPFAHIALRGSKGQLLQRKAALVPVKYCDEFTKEAAKAARVAMKAERKARHDALAARLTAQLGIDVEALCWD
jgi:hypothetical protein